MQCPRDVSGRSWNTWRERCDWVYCCNIGDRVGMKIPASINYIILRRLKGSGRTLNYSEKSMTTQNYRNLTSSKGTSGIGDKLRCIGCNDKKLPFSCDCNIKNQCETALYCLQRFKLTYTSEWTSEKTINYAVLSRRRHSMTTHSATLHWLKTRWTG